MTSTGEGTAAHLAARGLRLAGIMGDVVDEQVRAVPGVAASLLGLVKVAAITTAAPVVLPAVSALATANASRARAAARAFPDSVAAALAGTPTGPISTVASLAHGSRAVITSDLHRCVAGGRDWPGQQRTRELYEILLDHYGDAGWDLIENGDVEDFWMVGGSTWGALYDVSRLASSCVPGRTGSEVRAAVYGEHLRRIVACNRGIYERIDDRFHRRGGYHRVIGNHDDVYHRPEVVEHLGAVHDGLVPSDAVVLSGEGTNVGIVTHGHQTDGWNGPGMAQLGRFFTWLACGVADAPLPARMAGVPSAALTEDLLTGRQPNRLTQVDPRFGATGDLYSLDEVELFSAFRKRWVEADDPVNQSPYLVLGHTHLALSSPSDPQRGATWARYVNIGSGVGDALVTAVEWEPDRTTRSAAQLVAWYVTEPTSDLPGDEMARTRGGSSVRRVTLGPAPTEPLLVAGGHDLSEDHEGLDR